MQQAFYFCCFSRIFWELGKHIHVIQTFSLKNKHKQNAIVSLMYHYKSTLEAFVHPSISIAIRVEQQPLPRDQQRVRDREVCLIISNFGGGCEKRKGEDDDDEYIMRQTNTRMNYFILWLVNAAQFRSFFLRNKFLLYHPRWGQIALCAAHHFPAIIVHKFVNPETLRVYVVSKK